MKRNKIYAKMKVAELQAQGKSAQEIKEWFKEQGFLLYQYPALEGDWVIRRISSKGRSGA